MNLSENVNKFNEVKELSCTKYRNLLKTVNGYVEKFNLNSEKHMKKYENSYNDFVSKDDDEIFKFFIRNYLHIMPQIVDHNIDYFLTQKPYILKRSKRGNKKKPNSNATYLCPNIMLRYVLYTLKVAPKNKVSENNEIKNIFGEMVQIFDLFYNEETDLLKELAYYITEHFSNSNSYKKMCEVIINYRTIIDDEEEDEEEVSTDDEGNIKEDTKRIKKKNKKSGFGMEGAFDLANGFFGGDSSIGQLAKEISNEINPEELKGLEGVKDQGELIKKLFTPGENGSTGFGNIMNKIIGKVGSKLADGSINQEAMSKEAGNLMNSLGGGGAAASLFKNMFSK